MRDSKGKYTKQDSNGDYLMTWVIRILIGLLIIPWALFVTYKSSSWLAVATNVAKCLDGETSKNFSFLTESCGKVCTGCSNIAACDNVCKDCIKLLVSK